MLKKILVYGLPLAIVAAVFLSGKLAQMSWIETVFLGAVLGAAAIVADKVTTVE